MTKPTMTDEEILGASIEIAERRLRAAAATKRLADADTAVPPRRVSILAWENGCMRPAGGDPASVQTLRDVLTVRASQYPSLSAYIEAMSKQIREGIWGGPPADLVPAPHAWDASRESAAAEVSLIGGGANLWHAIALAVEDLA